MSTDRITSPRNFKEFPQREIDLCLDSIEKFKDVIKSNYKLIESHEEIIPQNRTPLSSDKANRKNPTMYNVASGSHRRSSSVSQGTETAPPAIPLECSAIHQNIFQDLALKEELREESLRAKLRRSAQTLHEIGKDSAVNAQIYMENEDKISTIHHLSQATQKEKDKFISEQIHLEESLKNHIDYSRDVESLYNTLRSMLGKEAVVKNPPRKPWFSFLWR